MDELVLAASSQGASADSNVDIYQVKRLIRSLQAVKGKAKSLISLVIPPTDSLTKAIKIVNGWRNTAVTAKSLWMNKGRTLLTALDAIKERLAFYRTVPKKGLVIYCGVIMTEDGKEKKVNIYFEPFKAVSSFLYICDHQFHTEPLEELLVDHQKLAVIVIDGKGAFLATLQGNQRKVLAKFSVHLPNKHGKGGDSAQRFERQRREARRNYLRKVAETAARVFIDKADKPTITGLVLAGSAEFKMELFQSDLLHPKLQSKIIKVVNVAYGGENGFNQAVDLAASALSNVKFVQEKELIKRFFEEIAADSGRFCFGVQDALAALKLGAVDVLICWEKLDCQMKKGMDEPLLMLEWLASNHKTFGVTRLEMVTDSSKEGAQFVRGFGGIGGILRYRVDFEVQEHGMNDKIQELELGDY